MQRTEEHVTGGGKIRSIILGLNDGLISTFTLLIGVAAATISEGNTIIILTGLAAMVSGATSMGLGEYISSKSEVHYIRNEMKREKAEIVLFPEEEKEEVREIFEKMGFQGGNLDSCVETITSNKQVWLDFLTKSELGLDEPENPAIGAILTFFAFVFGSSIPLLPYFLNLGFISLLFSSIVSFGMLFIAGASKSKITGERPLKGAIEMLIVGTIAFIVSYSSGILLDYFLLS